jgi:hypothetical protein
MGNGGNAKLWRISSVADQLTFRPRAKLVQFGKSVTVSGYMTAGGGAPVGAGAVDIGTVSGDQLKVKTSVQTGADGFYSKTVKPTANATWSAEGITDADRASIQVAPRVTMTLSHLKASTRLSEILSGSVSPNHKGKKVLVQKRVTKTAWKTVASGRLDARSRYKVTWYLPFKTATYSLRVILPAHSDHAQGTSPTGTLRVKIRKG